MSDLVLNVMAMLMWSSSYIQLYMQSHHMQDWKPFNWSHVSFACFPQRPQWNLCRSKPLSCVWRLRSHLYRNMRYQLVIFCHIFKCLITILDDTQKCKILILLMEWMNGTISCATKGDLKILVAVPIEITFFLFILFPRLCGVDVLWHTPPFSTVILFLPRQSLLFDIIVHIVQPSSLRPSSLHYPLYFHCHCPSSSVVLLSSHHMPIALQPPFLDFLCDNLHRSFNRSVANHM